MPDWAIWTPAQVEAAVEEIEVYYDRQRDIWLALKYLVYRGPDCQRSKLLEEGKGRTDGEALFRLTPLEDN